MSELYKDFTDRLKALQSENGGSLEIISVQEANCPEVMLEILAACHDDLVLRPEDDEDISIPRCWGLEAKSGEMPSSLSVTQVLSTTAVLSFATTDADDAGHRLVSFHWAFDETGSPGLAEMKFSDSKTFKLEIFQRAAPRVCPFPLLVGRL